MLKARKVCNFCGLVFNYKAYDSKFEIYYDICWAKTSILYDVLSSEIMCYNFSKKFNFMHTSLMIFPQFRLKN